jgi:hypothetical protein
LITSLPPSLEALYQHFSDFFDGPATPTATQVVRSVCDGTHLKALRYNGSNDGPLLEFLDTIASIPDAKARAWTAWHLLKERRRALHAAPAAPPPPPRPPTLRQKLAWGTATATALLLLFLAGTALAIQLGWTNARSRAESDLELHVPARVSIESGLESQIRTRKRIERVLAVSPTTGQALWNVLSDSGDGLLLETMLTVADTSAARSRTARPFEWSQSALWDSTSVALQGDLPMIREAARRMGLSPRLVALPALCEHLRRAESFRETYKRLFTKFIPMGNLSMGVTGIKPESLGRLLPYCDSADLPLIDSMPLDTIRRRLQSPDHSWSYLYAALYMKCVIRQWREAGIDISRRPEIVMTIYNLGLNHCPPRPNPLAGGAVFQLDGVEHSFGSFSREFYWSGQLYPQLPF